VLPSGQSLPARLIVNFHTHGSSCLPVGITTITLPGTKYHRPSQAGCSILLAPRHPRRHPTSSTSEVCRLRTDSSIVLPWITHGCLPTRFWQLNAQLIVTA